MYAVPLAWISVGLGVVLAVVLVPFLRWGLWGRFRGRQRGMRALEVGVVRWVAYLGEAVLPASVIAGAAFCILYAIINPLLVNNFFNLCGLRILDFLNADYRNNTLLLRILSVWLGFHALKTAFQFILVEGGYQPWQWRQPFNWVFKEPELTADAEKEYALDITDLAQFGLYIVAVNTWWWVVIRPGRAPDVLLPVLSGVLLAVFDDYLIISQYAHRNAEAGWWQKLRLLIANLILVFAVVYTIFRPLHLAGRALNIWMLVVFMGWYYIGWSESNYGNVTKIVTILNTIAFVGVLLFAGYVVWGGFWDPDFGSGVEQLKQLSQHRFLTSQHRGDRTLPGDLGGLPEPGLAW